MMNSIFQFCSYEFSIIEAVLINMYDPKQFEKVSFTRIVSQVSFRNVSETFYKRL